MAGNNNSSRLGLFEIICICTLIFIILKLFNIIAWDWLWVLSPLWIGGGGIIIFALIVAIYVLLIPVERMNLWKD